MEEKAKIYKVQPALETLPPEQVKGLAVSYLLANQETESEHKQVARELVKSFRQIYKSHDPDSPIGLYLYRLQSSALSASHAMARAREEAHASIECAEKDYNEALQAHIAPQFIFGLLYGLRNGALLIGGVTLVLAMFGIDVELFKAAVEIKALPYAIGLAVVLAIYKTTQLTLRSILITQFRYERDCRVFNAKKRRSDKYKQAMTVAQKQVQEAWKDTFRYLPEKKRRLSLFCLVDDVDPSDKPTPPLLSVMIDKTKELARKAAFWRQREGKPKIPSTLL